MATEEKLRLSGELQRQDKSLMLPTVKEPAPKQAKPSIHPAVYIVAWISLSLTIILFNKWILSKKNFAYPVILTTWHLVFATIMTQVLARTTTLLDDRKTVKMTGRVYVRAILPIGILFSLSLICGNLTYLYLNVAFIQMLKSTTPVAVLLAGWAMGVTPPSLGVLSNVSFIVIGVILASFGEITFVLAGFLFQCGGIIFEAMRLVLVQKLLNGAEYKMDPLLSLYYFAPLCAVMNATVALVWEVPHITMKEVYAVGLPVLFANALIAFLLNVSAVFLIGRTSSLVLALCGILKDVLLVVISVVIWGDQVSPLQCCGYAIALCGLIYYKLGAEQLKTTFQAAGRRWSDIGVRRPVLRVLISFFSLFILIVIVLVSLAPTYAPDYDPRTLLPAGARAAAQRWIPF